MAAIVGFCWGLFAAAFRSSIVRLYAERSVLALVKLPCVTLAMMPFEVEASEAKDASWAGKSNVLLGSGLTCVCHGKSSAAAVFGIRSIMTNAIHAMRDLWLKLRMSASVKCDRQYCDPENNLSLIHISEPT